MMNRRRPIVLSNFALVSFALLGAAPAMAGAYTFTKLLPPGQTRSRGFSINASDQVVGDCDSGAFVWSAGTFTQVSIPGKTGVRLEAINDRGVAAGRYLTGRKSVFEVFTYSLATGKEKKPKLTTKAANYVGGISRSGVVAGWSLLGVHPLTEDGFLIKGTTVTPLLAPGATATVASAISPGGTVAGTIFSPSDGEIGFTYQGGTFTTIVPPNNAGSINISFIRDNGTFGGNFVDVSKAGDTLGFVATGGTYSIYAYPNGGGIASATKVVGIGSAGEVVGTHLDPAGLPHGFVYSGGTYFNIDAPSATQTLVTGVNANGSLVGYYSVGQVVGAFIAQCPAGQRPCTQ